MTDKIKLIYPIIVEGKYDKIKIESIFETPVITTEGFGIFKNVEKRALIKKLCDKSPVIVLTDSDRAGKVIRSHLSSLVPPDRAIQVYVPQLEGKERRKDAPSADGYLGVEGLNREILIRVLSPYAGEPGQTGFSYREITTREMYELGLTGHSDSALKRDRLCKQIGLPEHMTAKAFRKALGLLMGPDELRKMLQE